MAFAVNQRCFFFFLFYIFFLIKYIVFDLNSNQIKGKNRYITFPKLQVCKNIYIIGIIVV